jgi:NAD-dependent DNA ligase
MNIKIIYVNSSNEVSARELEVIHEDEKYIDACCFKSGGVLKIFRKDRILEIVDSLDDPAVISKVSSYQAKYPLSKIGPREKWINRDSKPEICFTGFTSKEKCELIEHAQANGFFVRTGVSDGLSFLVCGKTAGPAKMKNARLQGAILLSIDAYRRLAETGELPIE